MYCKICYSCTIHVLFMYSTCDVHVLYMCKIPLTPNSFNPFLYSFTSHIRNMAPSIEKWAWQHFNDIHEWYPPAELTEKVSMCSKRTRWTLIPNSRRMISWFLPSNDILITLVHWVICETALVHTWGEREGREGREGEGEREGGRERGRGREGERERGRKGEVRMKYEEGES